MVIFLQAQITLMAYLCPECGYEQDDAGDCPSCQVPLESDESEKEEEGDSEDEE